MELPKALEALLVLIGQCIIDHQALLDALKEKGIDIEMEYNKCSSHWYWTLAILLVVTTLVVQDVLKATKVATTNPSSCALQVAGPKMWVSQNSPDSRLVLG